MSRNSVLRGEPIELTAYFLDAGGDYVDPTDLKMAVYPPGKDPRLGATTADAWVYDVTLTSEGSGPHAVSGNYIQKIDVGKYKYVFTVPDDVIVGGGSVGTTPPLYNNNMLLIELDSSIADTDGNTLGEDITYYFTTTYDPLYTSVRRIRLDLGSLVRDIPDDTINLAIFEASLEADALSFGDVAVLSASTQNYFKFARRQYVTCVAELILLNSIQGSGAGTGGRAKRLADLQVNYGSEGQIGDLLNRAISCRIKWEAALTSAGEIAPGTSQRPSMVIKGNLDPDRPSFGRDWQPISTYDANSYPAANTSSRKVGNRRWKRDFSRTRWESRFNKEYK